VLKENGYWNQVGKITVCDSHGKGENIDYFSLQAIDDRKSFLISGPRRKHFMMEGVKGHDMAFFIGYHAKFGENMALMDHAYGSKSFHKVRINGEEVSEVVINAYLAAEYGVPVALVSGDNILKDEVKGIAPDICFVETKEGRGRFSACFYPLCRIRSEYAEALNTIFADGYRGKLFEINKEAEVQIDLQSTSAAELCALVPGAVRLSGYTIQFFSDRYKEAFKFIQAAALISRVEI
jgi:D-amino peptidase